MKTNLLRAISVTSVTARRLALCQGVFGSIARSRLPLLQHQSHGQYHERLGSRRPASPGSSRQGTPARHQAALQVAQVRRISVAWLPKAGTETRSLVGYRPWPSRASRMAKTAPASPDRAGKALSFLLPNPLARLLVDEVHHVSEWHIVGRHQSFGEPGPAKGVAAKSRGPWPCPNLRRSKLREQSRRFLHTPSLKFDPGCFGTARFPAISW